MTDGQFTSDFIKGFLSGTEKKWSNHKINNGIYGFQFQPGTKWIPGLSQKEIDAYQSCRYVGACETSFFMTLFGQEDDLNEPERTRHSAQIAHSQAR
jgi:hypothetical protein